MFNIQSVSAQLGNKTIHIETGKLAKQAGGSVTVRCGDTIVLVTAVVATKARVGIDFFPLTVDYVEKTYAAGKIPGGFFKREGRPTEKEVLTSRFIDRPIRPLFPDHFQNDVQVTALVLSADPENDPDVLAMVGASAALMLTGAPFQGPIAGCRIGRINGDWVLNPSAAQLEKSELEMIVAATKDAIVMVEGGGDEVSEEVMIEAILKAHQAMQPLLQVQVELASRAAKAKMEVVLPEVNQPLIDQVKQLAEQKLAVAIRIPEKQKRYQSMDEVKAETIKAIVTEGAEDEETKKAEVKAVFEDLKRTLVREMILKDNLRVDGRNLQQIRPIICEAGLLPRAHGSALFTRGETQAIVATTLGTEDDLQIIDTLMFNGHKNFMLHYNFPPFSVGEVRNMRSPGRREIGHGALAERAIRKVMPKGDFPYTIRIVAEILESNGSSSMATVCGASLSLMDAGIQIKAPVAGIAMGLIQEEGKTAILSDILGDEDHLGDMDFKVAGTTQGITAIQMDIKIQGLTHDLLKQALEQARVGRLHILSKMDEALTTHRKELSPYAPRVETLKIPKDRIREVIGTGGKVIRWIIEETGAKIDVNDEGLINIYSSDGEALAKAKQIIQFIVADPEEGKTYLGRVQKIMDFGAFVEILPGTDGLVHISQLADRRVERVTDILKEGDEVVVKCIGIDRDGKIKLSLKEAVGLVADIVPIRMPR
ncbi:MAG: polyribonucleotide nucleotidyltransferase [Deltaproteobacteria bacterium]|nr:polyribonucleotide nucleotidyltransferase [Deltaproteobacteria bacterium]